MDPPACKQNKQQNVVNAQDRISDLPESIISRILSCLPTKDAVRTGVLSRSWKYMGTTITDLHFDGGLLYSGKKRTKKEYFMNFVERVLLLLGSSTIHTFILHADKSYDVSRVNAWISSVLRRNVKKLDICYMVEDLLILRSINNCDTLVELKLATFYSTLKVRTSLTLSKLTILDLFRVKISNESCPHFNKLLLSFPVLENFVATECIWLNAKTVIINSPSLESFEMSYSHYEGIPDGSQNCEIKFLAPCLTKFLYFGYLLEEFILPSAPLVLHANISLSLWEKNIDQVHEMGLRAYILLKHFSPLNHLTLADETIEGISSCDVDVDVVLASSKVPSCLLSHLKVVLLKDFYWTEYKLSLVKYLMENAKVLEEITITNTLYLSEEELMERKMQILTFPKASSQARIVFS